MKKNVLKNVLNILISYKTTLVLLMFFAVAIGYATFVEQRQSTQIAKEMIYGSLWLEILLFVISANLIGIIIKRKLYKKAKLTIFLFHIGFITMLLGAFVTKHFGKEGTMHIREGESSNIIHSRETYLRIIPDENDKSSVVDVEMDRKTIQDDGFDLNLNIKEKGELKLTFKNYIFNAVEEIIEQVPDGKDMLDIRVATKMGNVNGILIDGETKMIGGVKFSFNDTLQSDAVLIKNGSGNILVSAPNNLYISTMGGDVTDSISAGDFGEFKENYVFTANENLFLLAKHYVKAKKQLVNGDPERNAADAVIADLTYKGKTKEIQVFGGYGFYMNYRDYNIEDVSLKIAYGSKPTELPFSIHLEDFRLERYPGSNNPSSYESDIVLVDNERNINEKHKIFMNNVLDHRGYRFFQSSYDRDELGTILSVNDDMFGTLITYASYIILLIGFVAGLFNKNSRFTMLRKRIRKAGIDRKSAALLILLLIGVNSSAFSQTPGKTVSEEHADKFGHLVVQTFDGRFEPVYTLADDILIKIYKKKSIEKQGKEKINSVQFLIDLMLNPEYWKVQKMIFVKDDQIKSKLGISGKYASFNQFFDQTGQYKMSKESDAAYMKGKADQTEFDREIMKVTERLNIFYMCTRGSMLKIFPHQNSRNNDWVSVQDSASYVPLTGSLQAINEDLQLQVLTYGSIFQLYLQSVSNGIKTNNYDRADQILGYISNIQRQLTPENVLPSESQIDLEVHYNKAGIFSLLKYIYMILSVFLLIFTFADHLSLKKNKLVTYIIYLLIGLLALGFLYHTYGLALRWYLTGHAPWSNGYEVLLFVAWGAILAGFVFLRSSKITLAATVLLAFLMLLTAGFSSYDPQLTNLVPVLKSYWLIIHVAVIVISYSFLGIGFMLGLMNLFLYAFKNTKNASKIDATIKDLSNINELNLIIGIILATIGTFLGAVWANESWGRYWGWDQKETWALIILMVYAFILHLRMVPGLNKRITFNIWSVIGFGTVIMTFFGVNYYFSKGLHSYATGDAAIFPTWAWIAIVSITLLIFTALSKQKKFEKIVTDDRQEH